ncbi:MAG: hypothetical protein M3011_14485 [Actinomycetota bacterium]|nr:hypothetical protein [Actinomycetota bacterium]
MKRFLRVLGGGITALALIAVVPATAAVAATVTTQCTDTLAPGTYGKVVVPAGAVCIIDGPITITNGLFIRAGATFVLGSEDHPGQTGIISGGVHATNAANVQIHFTAISGGIDIHGGSGPFGGPFNVTWNTIEDSSISGPVVIEGYNGFWMGFIRNKVSGTVTLKNNVLADEDANEYVTNVISGDLVCSGNSPAPQTGDSEGMKNVVSGTKRGQCRAV